MDERPAVDEITDLRASRPAQRSRGLVQLAARLIRDSVSRGAPRCVPKVTKRSSLTSSSRTDGLPFEVQPDRDITPADIGLLDNVIVAAFR
jgi:hypothetical protein